MESIPGLLKRLEIRAQITDDKPACMGLRSGLELHERAFLHFLKPPLKTFQHIINTFIKTATSFLPYFIVDLAGSRILS